MTFRQVLEVLWQRRLLIGATLVLILLVAMLYLSRQVPTYTSQATIRMSAAATSAGEGSGSYEGIELDLDTESVTSPAVLEPAAQSLGGSVASDVGTITATLIEGIRTNRITIDATGSTPEESQARANAVATAYVGYLQAQVDAAAQRLEKDKVEQTRAVNSYGKQVAANPDDQVALTNLASATTALSDTNDKISKLENAGAPAVVLKEAGPGASDATPPVTVIAIGLLAGLLAGAGVALVREQFDDRLRDQGEIEPLTGVPALGELALNRQRTPKGERPVLPTADRRHTAFNEGVRALRTSLQVLMPPEHGVLVMTSPEPGDGKTFVTANLAVSWARAGKKVVLVGGDLRRPRLDLYFGEAADGAGFADLASRGDRDGVGEVTQADVASVLRPTEFEGLSILPPGDVPPDPADLLAKRSARAVVDHLRHIADVVIIDSPPALGMTDATLLAGMADGVAVLASAGRSNRSTLIDAVRTLRSNNRNVLGVILNRSRRRLPKSYRDYYLGSRSAESRTPSRVREAGSEAPEPVDAAEQPAAEATAAQEAVQAQETVQAHEPAAPRTPAPEPSVDAPREPQTSGAAERTPAPEAPVTDRDESTVTTAVMPAVTEPDDRPTGASPGATRRDDGDAATRGGTPFLERAFARPHSEGPRPE